MCKHHVHVDVYIGALTHTFPCTCAHSHTHTRLQSHPLERSIKNTPLRRTESLKVQPAYRSEGTPTRGYRDAKLSTLQPLNEIVRCESPDSTASERKYGYNGSLTMGNVYSDLQTDKRMSVVSTSTAGSGSACSDGSYSMPLYYEGERSQLSPLAVSSHGIEAPQRPSRSGYENVDARVPNRPPRNDQEDLAEVNR